jgi:hypothetical protein
VKDISSIIYTQIADVECECDGFLNYDRTHKLTTEQISRIYKANVDLISTPVPQ